MGRKRPNFANAWPGRLANVTGDGPPRPRGSTDLGWVLPHHPVPAAHGHSAVATPGTAALTEADTGQGASVTEVFTVMAVVAAAAIGGRLVSRRLGVPAAATYVVLGVLAAYVPGMSTVELSPDVVLLLFLPPLLYFAAFFSDPRETMHHLGPVVGQALGLVLVTAGVAAGTLLSVFPDIGWAAAIAFGAAIAPPDPVAATTVLQRLGAPRRLITVLEGEGLVNDGVALTLFGLAVGSVGATTSLGEGLARIAIEVGGGIGIGLAVGIALVWLRKRIHDADSQVVLSLVTPYLAFVPAHHVHASGVLATVTAAAWLGTRGRGLVPPSARLRSETFWALLNTLLVAVLFVLLGLQLPRIAEGVSHYPLTTLALASAAMVVATVVIRLVWVIVVGPMLTRRAAGTHNSAGMPLRERVALGWCGPRGAVSLAVALSIPTTTAAGAPFPRRDLLIFLTMVVVLTTLVVQILPLAIVLRRLGLCGDDQARSEGLLARRTAVDAALRELDVITDGDGPEPPGADGIRQVLQLRRDRLDTQLHGDASNSDAAPRPDHRGLRLDLLGAERRAVRDLYDEGRISRRTAVEVSQELDLDETRLRKADEA